MVLRRLLTLRGPCWQSRRGAGARCHGAVSLGPPAGYSHTAQSVCLASWAERQLLRCLNKWCSEHNVLPEWLTRAAEFKHPAQRPFEGSYTSMFQDLVYFSTCERK